MLGIFLAILVIVAVGSAGLALVPSALGNRRAEKRRLAFQGDLRTNRIENTAGRIRDQRRKSVQQALKSQADALKAKKRRRVTNLLFQAGLKTTMATYIRNCIIFGVVLFIVLLLSQVPYYIAILAAPVGAYILPRLYLLRRRKKYQDRFLNELPNAVEAIVRGVKTGLPLNDSIRLVAKDAKEPVRSEFVRVVEQQAFGLPMSEAVEVLLGRVPLPEVNFFVVVIGVQQQSGGNLSEALGNLARVLRNRKRMKQKVAAMSSEAKASAGIIGALPAAVAIMVSIVSPDYLAPLFTTTIGHIWLGIAAAMLSFGIFVMHRMVQFEI